MEHLGTILLVSRMVDGPIPRYPQCDAWEEPQRLKQKIRGDIPISWVLIHALATSRIIWKNPHICCVMCPWSLVSSPHPLHRNPSMPCSMFHVPCTHPVPYDGPYHGPYHGPYDGPCGHFLKWGYPSIIDFSRISHYKPSILRYPHFRNPSYAYQCWWIDDHPPIWQGQIPHPQCVFWRPGSRQCPHTWQVEKKSRFETSMWSLYEGKFWVIGIPKTYWMVWKLLQIDQTWKS